MGTLLSTRVNPVSHSLKSVLTELSSQITNLHSDVNGRQKSSIYFLCSNFHKSNDIVVTVKYDVARTTTVNDMQFFSIFPKGLKEVIIHLKH